MRRLSTLKREAQRATAWRGHRMRWRAYTDTTSGATCRICGATVGIDTDPPPNGVDIAGNAVALNCPIAPERGAVHPDLLTLLALACAIVAAFVYAARS